MNQQDQQAIDELFRHLYQSAGQAGTRDPQAEARIQQLFQQGPPGLLYQMAQTIVAQQHALNQAKAQLAAQPDGAPAGFGAAGSQGYGGYPAPAQSYQQPGYQRQPAGGGFLAGAGKIALGVGGGILAADAISSIFDGGGLFGGDRDYDGNQQDYAGQGDFGGQGFDDGGFGSDDNGW